VVLSFEVGHVYALNIFLHLQTVVADATAGLEMFSISILRPENLAGRNLRHMSLSLGSMVGSADLLNAIKHNWRTSGEKMAFSVTAQDVDGLLLQLVDLFGAV